MKSLLSYDRTTLSVHLAWSMHNAWPTVHLPGRPTPVRDVYERLLEIVRLDLGTNVHGFLEHSNAGMLLGIRGRGDNLFDERSSDLARLQLTTELYCALSRHMFPMQLGRTHDESLLSDLPVASHVLISRIGKALRKVSKAQHEVETLGERDAASINFSTEAGEWARFGVPAVMLTSPSKRDRHYLSDHSQSQSYRLFREHVPDLWPAYVALSEAHGKLSKKEIPIIDGVAGGQIGGAPVEYRSFNSWAFMALTALPQGPREVARRLFEVHGVTPKLGVAHTGDEYVVVFPSNHDVLQQIANDRPGWKDSGGNLNQETFHTPAFELEGNVEGGTVAVAGGGESLDYVAASPEEFARWGFCDPPVFTDFAANAFVTPDQDPGLDTSAFGRSGGSVTGSLT